ncbi:MAG TPA: glycoside hydrolase family 3 N-terminal domain-containing protein [Edaphocola sp.]|nr:glycoside hydrolase family 3 N-terminal domain-containing protein [Edaphocola sp.]
MNKMILLGLTAFLSLCYQHGWAQSRLPEQAWVDSVYSRLSPRERIGQLFMVAAYSGGDNYNKTDIEQLIRAHQIGGVIFMQGTAEKQAVLTNEYQKMAQVPLLIGMDGEYGLGMRLTGVRNYPYQMLLGATRDTQLVRKMGAQVAAQCKRLGVHIDFAPDVDVNNNPKNPVINFRSFGQDKYWVARLGIAYMKGLQDNGVMACAKHFPGHGDVAVDSHKDLPVVDKSIEEIKEVELYPFREMIAAGVKSVMVAHLDVPAMDNTPHLPTTLSKKVVSGWLKDSLGFKGLIFTDALNMKGVTKYYPDGETDLKAFLAGNDVLLFSQDVPLAIKKIQAAIDAGLATEADLEQRVRKILRAKYEAGLNDSQPVDTENVTAELNARTDDFWAEAAAKAVTLVKDEQGLINALNRPGAKIASLQISVNDGPTDLEDYLEQRYRGVTKIHTAIGIGHYDAVVVGIHHLNRYPGSTGSYGLTAKQIALIKALAKKKNVCFVVFGNAYLMKYLCGAATVIMAYEDNKFTETAAMEALKGKLPASGTLPVLSCK